MNSASVPVTVRTGVRGFDGPPEAPINLSVDFDDDTSVVDKLILSWADETVANIGLPFEAEGYRIERSMESDTAGFEQVVELVALEVLTYTDTELDPNTTYYYRVLGFNKAGVNPVEDSVVVKQVTRPEKPMNPVFEEVYSSSISVTWLTNHPVGSKFEIQMSEETDFTGTLYSTVTTKTKFEPVMIGTVTNMPSETNIYARMRSIPGNPALIVDPPDPADYVVIGVARTLAPVVALDPPENISVAHLPNPNDFNKLEISWDAVDNALNYEVERSPTGTRGFEKVAEVPASDPPVSVETAVDSGPLLANKNYHYRVRAIAGDSASHWSEEEARRTKAAPVEEWGTFDVSETVIMVRWSAPGNNIRDVTYQLQRFLDGELEVTIETIKNKTESEQKFLEPNTPYQFKIRSLNLEDIPSTPDYSDVAPKEVVTLAKKPIFAADSFPERGADFFTVTWNPQNPDGTLFDVEFTSTLDGAEEPDFSNLAASDQTTNVSSTFIDLQPETRYYGQVRAVNHEGNPTHWLTGLDVTTLLGDNLVARPTNLQLNPLSPSRIGLTWDDNSNPPESEEWFAVERSLDEVLWTEITNTIEQNATTYEDGIGLVPDARYYYRVWALRGEGRSSASDTASTFTLADDPVLLPDSVDVSPISMNVTWGQGGNHAGTEYEVRWASDPFDDFTASPILNALTYNIDPLLENTTYQIEVRALNGAVPPRPTDWIPFGRVATKADEVAIDSINPIDINFVVVNFLTGNNPPGTEYEIEGSIFSDFHEIQAYKRTTDEGSTTISDLAGATEYYFQVRAISHGEIPTFWQEFLPITTREPPLDPDPPTGLKFDVVTPSSIDLSWDALPVIDPDPPIDNYRLIRRMDGGAPTNIDVGIGTAYTDDAPLTPNTQYSYQVMAQIVMPPDDVRFSTLPSPEMDTVTHSADPGALVSLIVRDHEIEVDWEDNGNPEDNRYLVKVEVGGEEIASSPIAVVESAAILGGLAPNTEHVISAQAINRQDVPTGFVEITRAITRASQPSTVTMEASVDSARFRWPRGNEIPFNPTDTDYNLKILDESGADVAEVTTQDDSAEILELTPNTPYDYELRAINREGHPTEALTGNFITDPAIPQAANVSVFHSSAMVEIVHAARNPPITQYRFIATDLSGSSSEIEFGRFDVELDRTLQGLSPNIAYQFELIALGIGGTNADPFPFPAQATLANAPTNPSVELGVAYFDVTWKANGNPPDTAYEVEATSQETPPLVINETTVVFPFRLNIPFRPEEVNYDLQVRSINRDGLVDVWVPMGTHSLQRPEEVIGVPNLREVRPGATTPSMELEWDPVTAPDSTPPDRYIIYRVEDGLVELDRVDNTVLRYQDDGSRRPIEPNTRYTYRVGAFLDPAISISDPLSAVTHALPINLSDTLPSATVDTITVHWEDGQNPNDPRYRLEASPDEAFATPFSSEVFETFATIEGLEVNTLYYTRGFAINSDQVWTDPTALNTVATLASQPLAGTPPIAAVTAFSIEVNWTSTNPPRTEFLIETIETATGNPGPSASTTDPNTGTVIGLTSLTKYEVYVSALNLQGQKTKQTLLGTETTDSAPTPAAPSNLVVRLPDNGDPTELNLEWLDNSEDVELDIVEEDFFDVYHRTTDGPVTLAGPPVRGVSGAGNQITLTVRNLIPNTAYFFHIVARQGSASSPTSNIVRQTTYAEVPVWSTPALTRTDKSITGTWWQGNNPDGTGYELEVSLDDFDERALTVITPTVRLSATAEGLLSNANYSVRVKAIDSFDYSEKLIFNTLAAVPDLPITDNLFTPDENAIEVAWFRNENVSDTQYVLEAFADEDLNSPVPEGSLTTTETSGIIGGLTGNTQYWFTVKAENRDGGFSDPRLLGAATTLPANMTVTASPIASTVWYGVNNGAGTTSFTFTTDAFPNNANYIRYKWITGPYEWPADDVQDTVPKWDEATGDLILKAPVTGKYYLHTRVYNAEGNSNPLHDDSSEAFQVDLDPPNPPQSEFVNVDRGADYITWRSALAVDSDEGNGAGLAPESYLWTIGREGTETPLDTEEFPQTGLTPNTLYFAKVQLRDNAQPPNHNLAVELEVPTFQNNPTGVLINSLTLQTADVTVQGEFPNMEIGESGLQVRFVDGGTEILSDIQKEPDFIIPNLNLNTRYDVSAQSFNQAGETLGWTTVFETITTQGTKPQITPNPPASPPVYPGQTLVRFFDGGLFDLGEIAYYRMVINEFEREPGTQEFEAEEDIAASDWSYTFVASQASYVHIRSYDVSGRSRDGDYVRLGPWIIDADPPVKVGIAEVTVHGVDSMTFHAGEVEDIGLAGFPNEIYSYDGGLTFTDVQDLLLEEDPLGTPLRANTIYSKDLVYQDAVGNQTAPPIHLVGVTHQNAPTEITIAGLEAETITLRAVGDFPNLDEGDSGIQFGQVIDEENVWSAQWEGVELGTFDTLIPNAEYKFIARARNSVGVETEPSPILSAFTLALPPDVRPSQGIEGAWTTNPNFEFLADGDKPSSTTYEYYLYAWNTNRDYVFTGDETKWMERETQDVDRVSVIADSSGKWYFHVRSVNRKSVNRKGDLTPPDQVMGWFGYDVEAPSPAVFAPPEPDVKHITWNAVPASDALSGTTNNPPYGWRFEGGEEGFTADPRFTTFDLTPNLAYNMELKIRDFLGNETEIVSQTARTLAAKPNKFVVFPEVFPARMVIHRTSLTVSWRSNGNPTETRYFVEISEQSDFSSLVETVNVTDLSDPDEEIMSADLGVADTPPVFPATPLNPNTTYYVRVHAQNDDDVPTEYVHLGTATTRPVDPDVVVSVNPANKREPAEIRGAYPEDTTFFGTSNILFGTGRVEYYLWTWNKDSHYTVWTGEEKRADDTVEISTTVKEDGEYWMHVASIRGGQERYLDDLLEFISIGPFRITSTTEKDPVIRVIDISSESIKWKQDKVTGENFIDSVDPYGFELETPDGWQDRVWVPEDVALAYLTEDLIPNTIYTMNAYLRDDVRGERHEAGPATAVAVTHQAVPTEIEIVEFLEESITVRAVGPFENLRQGQTGFQFLINPGEDPSWTPEDTWTVHSLSPNTFYTFQVSVTNSEGIATRRLSPATSVTTLAVVPSHIDPAKKISLNTPHVAGGYYPSSETFEFSNSNIGFGKGNVEYYQVIVNGEREAPSLADFDAQGARWNSDEYSHTLDSAGIFYFHFRSYNSARVGGPPYTFGDETGPKPFTIDDTPPTPNPPELAEVLVNVDSVVWTAVPATDANLVNIHYNFDYPNNQGWQSSNEYSQSGLFPPNSPTSIKLVVRDFAGNETAVLSSTTYTRAQKPTYTRTPEELKVHVTSATFHWLKHDNSPETLYEVAASRTEAAFRTEDTTDIVSQVEVGLDKTSGTVTGLQIATKYHFAVRAFNVNGLETTWEVVGNGTTSDTVVPPEIVSPLEIETTLIRMNWVFV